MTDSGGLKTVHCYTSEPIAPAAPAYTWEIARPVPLLSVTGSGTWAATEADWSGSYSCMFTATVDRDCPPAEQIVGPTSKTLTFSATLTADPTAIPARSLWQTISPYAGAALTVTWEPPECEGTLEIVEVLGDNGYIPPDAGTVEPGGATGWIYRALLERQSTLCPEAVNVRIAAKRGDAELDDVTVRVLPIHTWWTHGHQHGPGMPTHPPDHDDFCNDFEYLWWKYGDVLATADGEFASRTVSTETCVPCPWPFGCVYACTSENPITGKYTAVFGTSTLSSSENQGTSIIGHELVHTTGADECPAYQWEIDHQAETGINPCDLDYRDSVEGQLEQRNCPP